MDSDEDHEEQFANKGEEALDLGEDFDSEEGGEDGEEEEDEEEQMNSQMLQH